MMRLISLLLPLTVWCLVVDLAKLASPEHLPGFVAVLTAAGESWNSGMLLEDLLATLTRWLSGFLIGATLGLLLGVVIGHSRVLRELSELPIEFFRALPVTALLPLFLLLFGVGERSKIAMAAFPAMLMLTVYTESGLQRCSTIRLEMARSFNASTCQTFCYLRLPELLPSLLLGLRLALSLSLVVSIVAEMFLGTERGLGQRIYEAYMMNSSAQLYAHILVIGALGYMASILVQRLEQRCGYWVGR